MVSFFLNPNNDDQFNFLQNKDASSQACQHISAIKKKEAVVT